MKTTLDIPDEIMRQAKIRAAEEGRKLKDVVAEALRSGLALALPAVSGSSQINVVSDPKTGLPVVAAITNAVGSSFSRQEIRDLEAEILDREDEKRAGFTL